MLTWYSDKLPIVARGIPAKGIERRFPHLLRCCGELLGQAGRGAGEGVDDLLGPLGPGDVEGDAVDGDGQGEGEELAAGLLRLDEGGEAGDRGVPGEVDAHPAGDGLAQARLAQGVLPVGDAALHLSGPEGA